MDLWDVFAILVSSAKYITGADLDYLNLSKETDMAKSGYYFQISDFKSSASLSAASSSCSLECSVERKHTSYPDGGK